MVKALERPPLREFHWKDRSEVGAGQMGGLVGGGSSYMYDIQYDVRKKGNDQGKVADML